MASFPLLELADMSRQQGLCTCCALIEQEGNDAFARIWQRLVANAYPIRLFSQYATPAEAGLDDVIHDAGLFRAKSEALS